MSDVVAASGSQERELTIDALADLRSETEIVAKLLRERLRAHLEALRPLFAPRRLLGRHVRGGARDDVPGAERALGQLRERFAHACGRPFSLGKDLPDDPLSIDPVVELYPFRYAHALGGDPERIVRMTSPVCWSIGYRCGYALAELEAALETRSGLRPGDVQQFLVNALVLQQLLETLPGIADLLRDLRYALRVEKRPHLGDLPLVTLSAPLASFRPPDAIISSATAFSGVPAFIELIEVEALRQLPDPLRDEIQQALQGSGS